MYYFSLSHSGTHAKEAGNLDIMKKDERIKLLRRNAMIRTTRWFALVCGLLLVAVPMFAATQNAVVYGTVYDAGGNPLAGATVTLENPAQIGRAHV